MEVERRRRADHNKNRSLIYSLWLLSHAIIATSGEFVRTLRNEYKNYLGGA